MEVNFIENQVVVNKIKHTFDIDFLQIVKMICEDAGFDIHALSEEEKDDIVLEFESNYNYYLNELIGVELEDLIYQNEEGFDEEDNLEEFTKLKEAFVNYVYETIYFC